MAFSLEDLTLAQSGYYEDVLSLLDEYSLYAHYLAPILGEDPVIGQVYSSPLRDDDYTPSWGMYRARKLHDREFGWKDQARNLSGDIFELVRILYGLESKKEALRKICADFGLGSSRVGAGERIPLAYREQKEKREVKISIKSRPYKTHEVDWWHTRYWVDRKRLERYQTTTFTHYWMYRDQAVPFYPRGMCYAYRIYDRYQLYFPQANKQAGERKFANDWNEACLPGFGQLSYKHDTLVIQKAYKDMLALSVHDICDVVAYRGENVPIPEIFWQHFRKNYKHIYIAVDNDGKSISPLYDGCSMIYMPREVCKDTAELSERQGPPAVKEYFLQSMSRIEELEDKLNEQYGNKCVTLYTVPEVTGQVDKVAIEVLGETTNLVFFFKQGDRINRVPIDATEAKELIHVHS